MSRHCSCQKVHNSRLSHVLCSHSVLCFQPLLHCLQILQNRNQKCDICGYIQRRLLTLFDCYTYICKVIVSNECVTDGNLLEWQIVNVLTCQWNVMPMPSYCSADSDCDATGLLTPLLRVGCFQKRFSASWITGECRRKRTRRVAFHGYDEDDTIDNIVPVSRACNRDNDTQQRWVSAE